MLQIEIDEGSGFCFGVTTAIKSRRGIRKRKAVVLPWRYSTQQYGGGKACQTWADNH